MANYHTQTSFLIECSSEQVTTSLDALNSIESDVSEEARAAITLADNLDKLTPFQMIVRHCFFNHPEQSNDATKFEDELCWDFSAVAEEDGIWISSDESINTEHAAVFVRAVLIAFDLPNLVEIEAAHTCSKPRLGAFGGHAAAVTKNRAHWLDTSRFLHCERMANENQERYFKCRVIESNGGLKNKNDLLVVTSPSLGLDPQEKLKGWISQRKREIEKLLGSSNNSHITVSERGSECIEIEPLEFLTMRPHLSVI